jgi:hypothetical protein
LIWTKYLTPIPKRTENSLAMITSLLGSGVGWLGSQHYQKKATKLMEKVLADGEDLYRRTVIRNMTPELKEKFMAWLEEEHNKENKRG